MVTPAVPATTMGAPLASAVNRALGCGCTRNAGVPWANRRVKVSPSTEAETIAGVPAGSRSAGGHDEASPDAVHCDEAGGDPAAVAS